MRHGLRELPGHEVRRHHRVLPRGERAADAVAVEADFSPPIHVLIATTISKCECAVQARLHDEIESNATSSTSRSGKRRLAAPASRRRTDPPRARRHAVAWRYP